MNRLKYNKYMRSWYKKNREKCNKSSRKSHAKFRSSRNIKTRERHLKKKYGIDLNIYNDMLDKQGGVCAICGRTEIKTNKNGKIQPLSVDHDHKTGAVRGLLCHRCNDLVGKREQELMVEVDKYIQKYSVVT